jgi:polyisoprenoid-binding protein YceI
MAEYVQGNGVGCTPRPRGRSLNSGSPLRKVRGMTPPPPRAHLAIAALAALLVLPRVAPAEWTIDPARSTLVVHVYRTGALSPLLHDHDLRPERWRGTIVVDPERPETPRVEVVIDARSLRDDQTQLSPADRAKVEEQVRGSDILDAARYPEIRFVADRLEITERAPAGGATTGAGVLSGTLTLHGKDQAIRIPIRGRADPTTIATSGSVELAPSTFGIAPYSRMLGTIAVEDRVTIEIAIEARPN